MNVLEKILGFFTIPLSAETQEERARIADIKFQERIVETGIFIYLDEGFIIQDDSENYIIQWKDIDRIVAYKADLLTVDEIRLDIFYLESIITLTEELAGWYQFVERIKIQFPNIQKNWDEEIVQPPFLANETIIYQK